MKKYNVYDTSNKMLLVGTIEASDHQQAIQKANEQFKLQYLYLEVV